MAVLCKLAAYVSAVEAELTKALEDTAQLEERNIQLSQQLSGVREKVSIGHGPVDGCRIIAVKAWHRHKATTVLLLSNS